MISLITFFIFKTVSLDVIVILLFSFSAYSPERPLIYAALAVANIILSVYPRIPVSMPDNTYIWADGYKVEEVIKNYMSNAINHVDDNNYIKVGYEQNSNSLIRFYIFNSGIQLENEELNKIWEKFYKVDKAHTRSYGGTGLGLSIVKAIAMQHNTVCGCKNTVINGYKGIKFYFDFSVK